MLFIVRKRGTFPKRVEITVYKTDGTPEKYGKQLYVEHQNTSLH